MNHLVNIITPTRHKMRVEGVRAATDIVEIQATASRGGGDPSCVNSSEARPKESGQRKGSAIHTVSRAFKQFVGMGQKEPVFIAKVDLEKDDDDLSMRTRRTNLDTMSAADLERYKLLEVVTTRPNGERSIRRSYESETNVYVPGESILKSSKGGTQDSVSGGEDNESNNSNGGEKEAGWRSRRRSSLQNIMNTDKEAKAEGRRSLISSLQSLTDTLEDMAPGGGGGETDKHLGEGGSKRG